MPWSLLIRNGTVVDGSGAPARDADVAVEGDRIAAVGPGLAGEAERVIDARGLMVAPGFIDIHSHSDLVYDKCPSAESKVRQGVTPAVNAVAVVLVVTTVAIAIAAEIRRRNAASRAMEAARLAQQADVEMAGGLRPQEAAAQ